jgi:tRNA dimethylallyltransferase
LLERGYGEDLPSMNSIGYKQAVAYLKDKMTKTEMIADIQQKSRHYAKKQLTWYKKASNIHWLKDNQLCDQDHEAIQQFLRAES